MKWSVFVFLATAMLSASPEPFVPSGPMIKLWPCVPEGSQGKLAPERWIEGSPPDEFHRVTDVHCPTLTLYLPPRETANGTAVIIAPGGGHKYLVVDLEGELVAKKLNEQGIAAFVLRYRLARAEGSTYRIAGEALDDLQQAIRVVRRRAAEWHVDPARVGVMGFSAGGHLAVLAENNSDADTRPDFVVLGYPAFIGAKTVVARGAPPTFIFVNNDDALATGAGEYFLSLRKADVPAEFHVFRRGRHGVGATGRAPGFERLGVAKWPELLGIWLGDQGLLRPGLDAHAIAAR